MKKGVILEITNTHLVILTANGEFLHGQKTGHDDKIGKEILFWPIQSEKNRFSFHKTKYITAVSLVAVMIFLLILGPPFITKKKAYAFVSFDINPSIELSINKNHRVISAHAFNVDGEKVLNSIKGLKNIDFYVAAEMILKKLDEMGYYEENNDLIIAHAFINKQAQKKMNGLQTEMTAISSIAVDNNVQLRLLETSMDDKNKAKKQGITIGLFITTKENKPKKDDSRENKKSPVEKPKGLPIESSNLQKTHPSERVDSGKRVEQKEIIESKEKENQQIGEINPSNQKQQEYKEKTNQIVDKTQKSLDDKKKQTDKQRKPEWDKMQKQEEKHEKKVQKDMEKSQRQRDKERERSNKERERSNKEREKYDKERQRENEGSEKKNNKEQEKHDKRKQRME
ncbi:anti-sigma-I factor RsgI family protein [Bacillus sp. FSL K6-3431]|uniref:anti-sigma-I factor RsgI family protein n=1 Tax=Bacillus sp. FSL K6-3431 TaxID=2921500 RepID=UPI0030F62473